MGITIQPKFAIGNEVWVMSFSHPQVMIVRNIKTETNESGTVISYGLEEAVKNEKRLSLYWQKEQHVCSTKKELLESFL